MASRWVVFITLLMACLVQLGYSAPILSKRETSQEDKEKTIIQLNEFRSAIARESNIANMNELVWDTELERKASKMTCHRMVSGPDYTLVVVPSEQAMTSFPEFFVNLIRPTQAKIGCFQFQPACIYASVCLVGPKNKKSPADFIEGEPGSACPGETRHDGLCVVDGADVTP